MSVVVPFPLSHDQRLSVLGRDDALVVYQRGLEVGVVFINHDGSAHSTELPIECIKLAFGKRAAAEGFVRPTGSAAAGEGVGEALRQFADAMAGRDGDATPCA